MRPSDSFIASLAATIAFAVEAELPNYVAATGTAWQRAFGKHSILQNALVYSPMSRWGLAHRGDPESIALRAFNEGIATLQVKGKTPN